MLCSISGTVPEEPVVSKKSGLLFERRLIEKVVQETGRCPVTDEPLDKDDLLAISTSKTIKPRPTPATSIPGLLSLFQNEWDATVLEAHHVRQSLRSTRQELSHALYQHDAATRVIARLLRERDAYRTRLENAELAAPPAINGTAANNKRPSSEQPTATAAATTTEDQEQQEPAGKKPRPALGGDIIDAMTACSNDLSKTRKKRVISPSTATPDDIAAFSLKGSYSLHNTRKGGILSLAIPSVSDDTLIATAGHDATVKIFDRIKEENVASLTGHKKPVLDVSFVGGKNILVSASADKTVRVWKNTAENDETAPAYECVTVLDDAGGDVVSVNVHPTQKYFYTASMDGYWYFYDVNRSEVLSKVSQQGIDGDDSDAGFIPFTASALHPDGLIFATGNARAGIKIWESRNQKCVASFDGHEGLIASLSFSENGYYLGSAASDGVKLWDLRKLKNFHSLTPYGEGPKAATATSVSFDHSGLFLAVGGADARVYGVKQEWNVVKEFGDVPKKGVRSVLWGVDAKSLMVGAADHNLRVFG